MYIQSQIHAENRRIGEKQQKICETKGIKKNSFTVALLCVALVLKQVSEYKNKCK